MGKNKNATLETVDSNYQLVENISAAQETLLKRAHWSMVYERISRGGSVQLWERAK